MLGAARDARREEARRLLAAYDLGGVARWAAREPRAWRALQSLLHDPDELVRWRAVEGCGRVARVRAEQGLEAVRESLRRTLWLMNDESGGLLWCGPQVLGAVLAGVPALDDEFAPLLAGYLEEEPFRVGTRWALWRLATVRPAVVAGWADDLGASLGDGDAAVRGHAALALRALALGTAPLAPAASTAPPAPAVAAALDALAADGAPVTVFDPRSGALRPTTVGRLAASPF